MVRGSTYHWFNRRCDDCSDHNRHRVEALVAVVTSPRTSGICLPFRDQHQLKPLGRIPLRVGGRRFRSVYFLKFSTSSSSPHSSQSSSFWAIASLKGPNLSIILYTSLWADLIVAKVCQTVLDSCM